MPGAVELILGGAIIAAALLASAHAALHKRESRAAALWIAIIWVMPAAGPMLYLLLGVNRVQRRAAKMRRRKVRHRSATEIAAADPGPQLAPLARMVGALVERPLLPGNAVDPLVNGEQAFPAMLASIGAAKTSIAMASYIFDGDSIGADFVHALSAAVRRGVEVRVLLDDVAARFSMSSAVDPLREAGVAVAVFNPPLVPARLHAINLRNHRKILVIDGHEGYIGGMNIDGRYWRPQDPATALRDLHFRLCGPAVAHLMEVFAEDWQFTTAEALRGEDWFPAIAPAGNVLARGIEEGPDESYDRLRWTLIGAVNVAQRSVLIATPYFIPDTTLITALGLAALRGVRVEILLPEKTDMPHAQWAAFGQLWPLLDHDCRVYFHPGRFDHSKLMVVDGAWTLIGSANWDARSLRLNFELNVECYGSEFGARMEELLQARIKSSRPFTLADLNARPLPVKLRDGVARLFAPYL